MDWSTFPSLTSLRAFEAAARNGSYSVAGRELNVSHSAVAQQVKSLEDFLGCKLVGRAGRGIALTDQGKSLIQQISLGFGLVRNAIDVLNTSEAEKPLNITMTPCFAVSWFLPKLPMFRSEHPDIDLVVNPTYEKIDLSTSDCDLAIRFGSGNWDSVQSEMLVPSDFVIVASPDLIGDNWTGDAEDLLRMPWLQELGTDEIIEWLLEQGFSMPRKAQITELPGYMLLTALRNGQGAAATARVCVEDDLSSGRLKLLHEQPQNSPTGYHVVSIDRPRRPSLQKFYNWIKRMALIDSQQDKNTAPAS